MKTGDPIFASIFGDDWKHLPAVLKTRYANRAYCQDVVSVTGLMDIDISPLVRLLAPLMRLSRTLPSPAAQNVPVTVHFRSEPDSDAYCFDRIFTYPDRRPVRFYSRMVPAGGNRVIEWMRIGIGWHARLRYVGERVQLEHLGYKIRLFGKDLTLPLSWLIGKGYAEEWALSENRFAMKVEILHPILGRVYGYSGVFDIKDINIEH